MTIVDDYILQHFPAKDSGNPETDDAYRARLCWIKHNYPLIKDVDDLCNLKKGMAKFYSHKYCWKKIKEKVRELEAKQDIIDLRNKQKETEKTHTTRNTVIGKAYEKRLQQLLMRVGAIEGVEKDPDLSVEEEDEIWDKILEIGQKMSTVQKDERTTAHLPNNYKDITGDLKLESQNTNINLNKDVPTDTELDELYENQFKEFINNALGGND